MKHSIREVFFKQQSTDKSWVSQHSIFQFNLHFSNIFRFFQEFPLLTLIQHGFVWLFWLFVYLAVLGYCESRDFLRYLRRESKRKVFNCVCSLTWVFFLPPGKVIWVLEVLKRVVSSTYLRDIGLRNYLGSFIIIFNFPEPDHCKSLILF